jgi:hypothetical protein
LEVICSHDPAADRVVRKDAMISSGTLIPSIPRTYVRPNSLAQSYDSTNWNPGVFQLNVRKMKSTIAIVAAEIRMVKAFETLSPK